MLGQGNTVPVQWYFASISTKIPVAVDEQFELAHMNSSNGFLCKALKIRTKKSYVTFPESGADPAQNLTYAQDRAGGGLEPPEKFLGTTPFLSSETPIVPWNTTWNFIIKGITKLPTYTSFKSAKYELH